MSKRTEPSRRAARRLVLASLAAVIATALALGCGQSAGARSPARHAHWISGVTLSEYWPVPESWFRGELVSLPGLPGKHRVDWAYSGTGMLMEGDGLGLDGQRYHVEDFGKERWVNPAGRPTTPTPSGDWTHGDPGWRVGGWRNARGAVTFPLEAGGWSNGPAAHFTPLPKVAFGSGPSLPLTPYRSVAVDPRLIPAGSRIYIPAYKSFGGGWFVAQDTGSGIIGRHIDIYRLPPPGPDGGRFMSGQRILVIPPAR